MSKLIDTLRTAIEPLRYLIGRNSERIDRIEANPASVQSDMAQSDPEAPDYIKNRIAYDNTNRKKIFEGILGGFRYGGEFIYSAEYDFVLKPNALYRIEVAHGGVIDSTVQRSVERDGGYGIDVVIVLDIAQVYSVSTDPDDGKSTFACYCYDEIPRKVTIFEVEEAECVKTVPRHLIYNLPHAAADTLGAVMVSDNLENLTASGVIWASEDITTDKYGKLHVRQEVQTPWSVPDGHILAATNKAWKGADIKDLLPSTVPVMPSAPTAYDSGKIPMVQSDGSWGLGEVPSGSGGGSAGGESVVIVRITITSQNGNTVIGTCDMNATEIKALMEAGKVVYLYAPDFCVMCQLTTVVEQNGDFYSIRAKQLEMHYSDGSVCLQETRFDVLLDGSVEVKGSLATISGAEYMG